MPTTRRRSTKRGSESDTETDVEVSRGGKSEVEDEEPVKSITTKTHTSGENKLAKLVSALG